MNMRTFGEYLRELHALPKNWEASGFEFVPDLDAVKVDGLLVEHRFGSGLLKGRPNYKKCTNGRRTFYVLKKDIEAWEAKREQTTGECMRCNGSGKRLSRWTKTEGSVYVVCSRCQGAGKVESKEVEA